MTASERIRAARDARDARDARAEQCEECDKPATHRSGIGNGYRMSLCADHTNERVNLYASAPQPCKQPWFRSL